MELALICRNGHRAVLGDFEVLTYKGKYCTECGEELLSKCPTCGADILSGMDIPTYCAVCGARYPWADKRRKSNEKND